MITHYLWRGWDRLGQFILSSFGSALHAVLWTVALVGGMRGWWIVFATIGYLTAAANLVYRDTIYKYLRQRCEQLLNENRRLKADAIEWDAYVDRAAQMGVIDDERTTAEEATSR